MQAVYTLSAVDIPTDDVTLSRLAREHLRKATYATGVNVRAKPMDARRTFQAMAGCYRKDKGRFHFSVALDVADEKDRAGKGRAREASRVSHAVGSLRASRLLFIRGAIRPTKKKTFRSLHFLAFFHGPLLLCLYLLFTFAAVFVVGWRVLALVLFSLLLFFRWSFSELTSFVLRRYSRLHPGRSHLISS